MQAIRITQVPGGDAPVDVRAAWVGLTIPVDPAFEQPALIDSGMVASKCYAGPVKGYTVLAIDALRELAKSSDAYQWWWKNARQYYRHGMHLVFNEEACELIDV